MSSFDSNVLVTSLAGFGACAFADYRCGSCSLTSIAIWDIAMISSCPSGRYTGEEAACLVKAVARKALEGNTSG